METKIENNNNANDTNTLNNTDINISKCMDAECNSNEVHSVGVQPVVTVCMSSSTDPTKLQQNIHDSHKSRKERRKLPIVDK